MMLGCQHSFIAIRTMGSVYRVIINFTDVFTIFLSVKTNLLNLIVQSDILELICNCLREHKVLREEL